MKRLFLVPLALASLTIPMAQADVIPEDSKTIERCEYITNLDAFPDIRLYQVEQSVNGELFKVAQVSQEACIAKAGYKFNKLSLYAELKTREHPETTSLGDFANPRKFIPVHSAISGMNVDVVPLSSKVEEVQQEFRILGYKDGMLHVATGKSAQLIGGALQVLSDPVIDGTGYGLVYPSGDAAPFVDTKLHFAKEYIDALYSMGQVQGRTKTLFAPNARLNRAEALKMIMAAAPSSVSTTDILDRWKREGSLSNRTQFSDVSRDTWYSAYVQAALESGFIAARTNFEPTRDITRAEFVKMLFNVLGSRYHFSEEAAMDDVAAMGANVLIDVPSDSWFADVVSLAVVAKVIEGQKYFYPERPITRGEAAKILYRGMFVYMQ